MILEYRAVADDGERRRTIGATLPGQPPPGGPSAALQDFRQRKFRRGDIEPLADEIGHTVEKCDRQCAPFHDERRADLV